MAEGALRNAATRWAWPTSRLSGRVTARRGTSNGSSKAISGRLEHLRASALGSRILTKHIARRLPTSEGQGPTTPLIGMSRIRPIRSVAAAVAELEERLAVVPSDPFNEGRKFVALRCLDRSADPAAAAALTRFADVQIVVPMQGQRNRSSVSLRARAKKRQPGEKRPLYEDFPEHREWREVSGGAPGLGRNRRH